MSAGVSMAVREMSRVGLVTFDEFAAWTLKEVPPRLQLVTAIQRGDATRAGAVASDHRLPVHGDVGAQEIHLTPRFQTSPKVQALVTALQRGLQMLHKQQAATSLPAILTPTAAMC